MGAYCVNDYIKIAESFSADYHNKFSLSGICNEGIAASKHNFFKLDKEFKALSGSGCGIRPFEIFPTQNIVERWLKYIEQVNSRLKKYGQKISFGDPQLAALLLKLNKINFQGKKDKNRLLRALGAVCETAFIGPFSIVVDLLHYCNTNCLHCWLHSALNTDKDPEYLKEKISLEMFSNIVGKAANIGTEKISLLANGEPLMHPEIKEMISICRLNGLKFEVVTNGVFMDSQLIKLIVDAGAVSVTISLPAASNASYKQICPASPINDFEKIKTNIRRLVDYRNQVKKRDPAIRITHVIHNLNCYDLPGFIEMDKWLGVDKVFFKIIMLDNVNHLLKLDNSQVDYLKAKFPQAAEELKDSGIQCDDLTGIYLDSYDKAGGLRTTGFYNKEGCLVGWDFCNVQLGGEVLFCCGNKMVDNLRNNDFDKIWFSDEYNRYRVAAKHINASAGIEFSRGEKLLDARCGSCENVNQHLHVIKCIKKFELEGLL